VRRLREESDVVEAMLGLGAKICDLNKGIKALWASNKIDGFDVKYKEPKALSSKKMDRKLGLRATLPEVYEELVLYPLHTIMFRVAAAAKLPVEVFQANPTEGVVKMVRYTDRDGDSDELIDAILKGNR
jgi:hypothetical protein